MKKEDKERVVAELTERLRTTETLLVADYRGLTMPQIDELRSKLIEHGARFSVVKNTLTRRAAEAAGSDTLLALLEGPTAIAFLESDGDPVAVAKAVRDAKAGKLEYRTDRGACVHVAIGKKSFDHRQLVENYAALLDEIVKAKPAAAKGRYIRQITLATTMSPGIRVDTQKTRGILEDLEASQQEAVPA